MDFLAFLALPASSAENISLGEPSLSIRVSSTYSREIPLDNRD